ncbi:spore germination protein [Bacillus vallismortis]|uniref:spore germination protein n=1 Tax=Bacillus vallismortis TaxID=72361 RepID=UPI002282CDFF|nr:spore germination protein [Bacillus vallismortis]MCY7919439.1 spore germination protein [Bacillus vallismortis]
MPAIVGPIYIMSISGEAAASFGDVFAISPKSVDHSGAGSGAFQLGDFVNINNQTSKTLFKDADIIDETVSFNG